MESFQIDAETPRELGYVAEIRGNQLEFMNDNNLNRSENGNELSCRCSSSESDSLNRVT